MSQLLTVPEVAQRKRAHYITVIRWITRGIKVKGKTVKLSATKTGGKWKVNPSSLEVFFSHCKGQ